MLVFVKFDKIQGSCDHAQYAGWSTVQAFDFSINYGADADYGPAANASRLLEQIDVAAEEDEEDASGGVAEGRLLADGSTLSKSERKSQRRRRSRQRRRARQKELQAQSLDVANRVVKRVSEPEDAADDPKDGAQSVSVGLSKSLDAATVELLRRAWGRGEPFASVRLDVCGVGEKGLAPVVRIEMRGVSVRSCSVDAAASSENVALQFQSVVFSYFPVDSQGQKTYSSTCQVGVNKSKSF